MKLSLEVTDGAALLSAWEATLPPNLQDVVHLVREHLPESYLVGGSVRDLLLRRETRDLDIVSPEPVEKKVSRLAQILGGKATCHEAFLTCTLSLMDGTALDLSTTRLEHYPYPGALPVVSVSDLAHDLYRRDFSVNTFALRLNAPYERVSVSGARRDLETQTLRALHDASFFDDPTRIVRGARLAARLGFSYDAHTLHAQTSALQNGAPQSVSPARFKNELMLCLSEKKVASVVATLSAVGALAPLYGLRDTSLLTELDSFRASAPIPDESYLLALLLALSEDEVRAFLTRFDLPQRLLASVRRLHHQSLPETDAETALAQLLYPEALPHYPRVRGSDVLSLGLPTGPEVGVVLKGLESARLRGEVASFADELELAKRLVQKALQENA